MVPSSPWEALSFRKLCTFKHVGLTGATKLKKEEGCNSHAFSFYSGVALRRTSPKHSHFKPLSQGVERFKVQGQQEEGKVKFGIKLNLILLC